MTRHRPCGVSHENIPCRSKSVGTVNETLFGYRCVMEKVG